MEICVDSKIVNSDIRHMMVLKLLLLPFSFLYKIITDLRNHLYDAGLRPSTSFDRVVISVGNLTVGGTGKTPFVELLVRLLSSDFNIAILSRGYGRKTRGFRLASGDDTSLTLGDEPFQYHKKFGDKLHVAVGEERALAIPQILFEHENVNLIILDDAFQHRSVKPQINILLNDYNRPFYDDLLMPAGRLRESKKHASRADLVVVTKCPEQLKDGEMDTIQRKINNFTGEHVPVYFTSVRYLEPVDVAGKKPNSTDFYLFTGIANPVPMVAYVQGRYEYRGHKEYPDHHDFTQRDITFLREKIEQLKATGTSLLTTEKDYMRILSAHPQFLSAYPVFYLPIELYFLKNEDCFARNLTSMIDTSRLQIKEE